MDFPRNLNFQISDFMPQMRKAHLRHPREKGRNRRQNNPRMEQSEYLVTCVTVQILDIGTPKEKMHEKPADFLCSK